MNKTRKLTSDQYSFTDLNDRKKKLCIKIWDGAIILEILQYVGEYNPNAVPSPPQKYTYFMGYNDFIMLGPYLAELGYKRTESFINKKPYESVLPFKIDKNRNNNQNNTSTWNNDIRCNSLEISSRNTDGIERIHIVLSESNGQMDFTFGSVNIKQENTGMNVDVNDMYFLIFAGFLSDYMGYTVVEENGKCVVALKNSTHQFVFKVVNDAVVSIVNQVKQIVGNSENNHQREISNQNEITTKDDIPF